MHLFSKIEQDPQNIVERDQRSYSSNRNGYSSISTIAANFTPGDSTLTINGVAKNLGSAGSIEFVDDDGFVDSGVYSGISTTNTATNCIVRVYEERFIADPNAGTYDARSAYGLNNTFGSSPGFRYKMLLLVPQTAYTNWRDVTLAYTSALPKGTVSIEGASDSFVNGTYGLTMPELTPATLF